MIYVIRSGFRSVKISNIAVGIYFVDGRSCGGYSRFTVQNDGIIRSVEIVIGIPNGIHIVNVIPSLNILDSSDSVVDIVLPFLNLRFGIN